MLRTTKLIKIGKPIFFLPKRCWWGSVPNLPPKTKIEYFKGIPFMYERDEETIESNKQHSKFESYSRPIGLGLKLIGNKFVSGPHVDSPSGISSGGLKAQVTVCCENDGGELVTHIFEPKLEVDYLDYWEGVTTKSFKAELFLNKKSWKHSVVLTQEERKAWCYTKYKQKLYHLKDGKWKSPLTKEECSDTNVNFKPKHILKLISYELIHTVESPRLQ